MAICHHTRSAGEKAQIHGKKRTDPWNENSKQVMMKRFPSDNSTKPHFARCPGAQLRNTGAEIHLSNQRKRKNLRGHLRVEASADDPLPPHTHLTRAMQHPDGWPVTLFVDESVIYIHVCLIIQI